MHKPEDFKKEPHKTASMLVHLLKQQPKILAATPEIEQTIAKLDYLLTAAKFRHMERFELDEIDFKTT